MLKFVLYKTAALDLVERLTSDKPIVFAPAAEQKTARSGELLQIAAVAVVAAAAEKRSATGDPASAEKRSLICRGIQLQAKRRRQSAENCDGDAANAARIAEFARLLDRRELILPEGGWSSSPLLALAVAAVTLYAERGPAACDEDLGEAAMAEAIECACLTLYAAANVLAFLGTHEAAAVQFGDVIHSIVHLSASRGPIVTPGEGWPDAAAIEDSLAASGVALLPR